MDLWISPDTGSETWVICKIKRQTERPHSEHAAEVKRYKS